MTTIKPHDMPHDLFTALAQGGGGPDAIERLVAPQHSKHLTLLYGMALAARQGDPADARLAEAGLELLIRARELNPAVADEVVRYPSVGAWALRTLRGDDTVPGTQPSGLARVAAAAAIRAGVTAEIEVPVTNGTVVLPSLGTARVDGRTAVVRTSPAQVRAAGQTVELTPGAPGWHELRPFRAGALDVLIDDLDPFRMPAADGEPTGRLTGPELTEFTAMLRDGWDVLAPADAAEIAAVVRVLVPYQAPLGGLVSTSSPETFGTVALSLPPDRYSCAEILVHETQHLKLSALLDLVPLTRPDDGRLYYAPWRDDPRPASGLLQGTYAFLGVARFWRRQRQVAPQAGIRRRAEAEFTRWRDAAALVARTLLESGQLTPAGADFTAEMARVLAGWQREPVSDEALGLARHKAEQHRAVWLADNDTSVATAG